MNERSKSLFRAAGFLRQGIARRRQDVVGIRLPEQQWTDCVRALRRIRLATERGWHRAAVQNRDELLYRVDQCRTYLHHLSLELQELGSAGKRPSEADIYRELLALDAEFEDVECDFEAEELCVTTPSVTLEGIVLGRFQVRLNWSQLNQSEAFRVLALDANPAESNDSVVHPHVSDESLCEGDGRRAIRAALDEGRLADFFLLVWRILDTYAPGQAYVELSDWNWNGTSCSECGAQVHEDDRCVCCGCDEVYCPECMSSCPHCDQPFCNGCISGCRICGGSVCRSCRDACATCQKIVCPDCLSDDKCQTCRDTEEEDDPVEAEGVSAAVPDSTVPEASRPTNEGVCHV